MQSFRRTECVDSFCRNSSCTAKVFLKITRYSLREGIGGRNRGREGRGERGGKGGKEGEREEGREGRERES